MITKTVSGIAASCRRKVCITIFMLFGATFTATAQVVDGRNFGIDGFAAVSGTPGTNHYLEGGTTGGEGGKVVYARTFQQLKAYLQAESPYIILVDNDMDTGIKCWVDGLDTGHLCDRQDGSQGVETTYGERVMIASNKTLIGIANPQTGEAPLFSRISFVMQCASNVIIRNCRFTMSGVPILKSGENKIVAFRDGVQKEVGDPDCIGIQADKNSAKTDFGGHIWVDHCTFFNSNDVDKDRYDGLLDCKNNVQWMTFSYNHFHDHNKACLFGKGDSDIFDDCRTISMHHNYFDNIAGARLPLQRGGYLHYFNNYMVGSEDGWDVRTEAVGYVQACYFDNCKSAIRSNRGGSLNIDQRADYDLVYKGCDNLIEGYVNIDGAKQKSIEWLEPTDWIPSQTDESYFVNNLDKTADVPSTVQKYAGAGKIEIWTAYADAVPGEDIDEYAAAIKDNPTEPTYDENGDKITDITSGITQAEAGEAVATQYYSLGGVRLAAPVKGVCIKKSIDADGNVSTTKLLTK